ncbi:hypothetical protein [Cyclobacterium jeungdonense]|uniref:Uncharacterized protein n=1 Tax=Cyclobacterium jeungdonense TaxID=708087 RepID=A0ABT8C8S5_9BACT|nr:hypothetical protein [Cyclobacterium jeungdonense]MDN3688772.1 hypothetical protein [Cyclobacterium jeungdonense]
MKKTAWLALIAIGVMACEGGDFSDVPALVDEEEPEEEIEPEIPEEKPFEGMTLSSVGGGAINYGVRDMLFFEEQLIVSGEFSQINGMGADYVGAYDGNQWKKMGRGLPNLTPTLLVHEGVLYAGGHFMHAKQDEALHLVKWNGNGWEEVGEGLNLPVNTLGVYQGSLIVGGDFTIAGIGSQDIPTRHIGSWNGERWRMLGSGLDGPAHTQILYRGELVVAGDFTTAGGESARSIATWNGDRWSNFGAGIDGQVFDLAVYKDELYATGIFNTAGGMLANHIAKWNGSEWIALGLGLNMTDPSSSTFDLAGRDLCVIGDQLWAGGAFNSAGGESTENIAIWDGESWHGTVPGPNNRVDKIYFHEEVIYLGGYFNHYDEAGFVAICKIEK